MDDVGTAAGLGGIDVAELLGVQPEIIDHRPGAAGRVARAEIAVDIVLGEPGILDRALRDLGVQLGGGFVRRMPGRVFVDPGNVGLALDGQNRGLRSRFFLALFSEPRWPDWQARKYSVGREGSGLAQVGQSWSAPLLPRRHCERSEAIQESFRGRISGLLRCARNDGDSKTLKVFCPTAQATFRFIGIRRFRENNPMHSRTVVDFKQEIVGWVSRRRNPPLWFPR